MSRREDVRESWGKTKYDEEKNFKDSFFFFFLFFPFRQKIRIT